MSDHEKKKKKFKFQVRWYHSIDGNEFCESTPQTNFGRSLLHINRLPQEIELLLILFKTFLFRQCFNVSSRKIDTQKKNEKSHINVTENSMSIVVYKVNMV